MLTERCLLLSLTVAAHSMGSGSPIMCGSIKKKKNSAQEPMFTLAYARYGHRSRQRLMELAGVLVRTFVVWKITFQSGLTAQWEMS